MNILIPNEVQAARAAPHQIVVLSPVSWETYQSLTADLSETSSVRLTYEGGVLEIMSPSAEHEMWNRQIERLIGIALLETGTNGRFLGSTTFKHPEESCGFEPDSCYYIQRFSQVKGLQKIDLSQHPAPDLVVEINVSQPLKSDRTGLFARLGIPEIWYFSDNQLKILHLSQGAYQERDRSLALPILTAQVLNEFLERLFETEDISLFQDFQSWVRKQAAPQT
jgi:Uma2 family endonuclease